MLFVNSYRCFSFINSKCFRSDIPLFVVLHRYTFQKRRYTTDLVIKSPYKSTNVSYTSLTEFVWKDLNKWSDKVAIQCAQTNQKYTYSELRKLCARFAGALRKKFRKGQVLAIVLPNIPQYPVVLLGAVEAGLVVTTLNPNFTPAELSRQIKDSETVVIITLVSLLDRIRAANKIIEENLKRAYHVTIITISENAQCASIFDEMIDQTVNYNYDLNLPRNGDDVVFLPQSSGTTGFPKSVQLTHFNIIHNLVQLNHELIRSTQEANGDFQEIVPAVIPFYHIFGLSALILTSLINGCKIISLKKFEPEKYTYVIKNEKATVLYLVPALVSFLNSWPSFKQNDLETVGLAFCAGGNTPVSEMEKLISSSRNKIKMRHAYGLTEASPAVSVSSDTDPLNTVGHLLSNTCVKIVDGSGTAKSSYQRGEICVKGPQVMKGYLNDEKATAETIDADGFLHTGDLGYYDDSGKLFYVDRIKELIKVKGFQVAPAELESIVKSYNQVKDVGVIGVPDERFGEKPVAFVVAESSKQKICEEDIKRYVAEHVAPYKQLATVIFLESIPRNPSGKILKRVLREKYAELS